MPITIKEIKKLNTELRYGVIYLAMPLEKFSDNLGFDCKRFINSPAIMSWLKAKTGFDIEIIDIPAIEIPTLIARRINVGNAGKDALLQMPLSSESMNEIQRFAECAIDVVSTDEGDKVLIPEVLSKAMRSWNIERSQIIVQSDLIGREADFNLEARWQERSDYKEKKSEDAIEFDADYAENDDLDYCRRASEPSTEIEEEVQILNIEQEREQALKAIQAQIIDYVTKYHDDPLQLINILLEGKIVIGGKDELSPLVVNNDVKIVLPYYNEVEVKMPAMCRAIYILFLKHPEGIALRDIGDYRADLENIYSMVMPGRSEEKAKEAIDNLLDPMSNTLNEYLSKIKRCFKSCIIDEKLASNYIITGKRGEPYRITLDPSLITLPRAVIEE
ncbi:MAG: hypothetical protein IK100_08895 [Muribaculaceae bacterium]|nr:hypothetical protein [Muribaculaceae bacterium]